MRKFIEHLERPTFSDWVAGFFLLICAVELLVVWVIYG
jgi:hypothetical protein